MYAFLLVQDYDSEGGDYLSYNRLAFKLNECLDRDIDPASTLLGAGEANTARRLYLSTLKEPWINVDADGVARVLAGININVSDNRLMGFNVDPNDIYPIRFANLRNYFMAVNPSPIPDYPLQRLRLMDSITSFFYPDGAIPYDPNIGANIIYPTMNDNQINLAKIYLLDLITGNCLHSLPTKSPGELRNDGTPYDDIRDDRIDPIDSFYGACKTIIDKYAYTQIKLVTTHTAKLINTLLCCHMEIQRLQYIWIDNDRERRNRINIDKTGGLVDGVLFTDVRHIIHRDAATTTWKMLSDSIDEICQSFKNLESFPLAEIQSFYVKLYMSYYCRYTSILLGNENFNHVLTADDILRYNTYAIDCVDQSREYSIYDLIYGLALDQQVSVDQFNIIVGHSYTAPVLPYANLSPATRDTYLNVWDAGFNLARLPSNNFAWFTDAVYYIAHHSRPEYRPYLSLHIDDGENDSGEPSMDSTEVGRLGRRITTGSSMDSSEVGTLGREITTGSSMDSTDARTLGRGITTGSSMHTTEVKTLGRGITTGSSVDSTKIGALPIQGSDVEMEAGGVNTAAVLVASLPEYPTESVKKKKRSGNIATVPHDDKMLVEENASSSNKGTFKKVSAKAI
jgi:hypothetical protein